MKYFTFILCSLFIISCSHSNYAFITSCSKETTDKGYCISNTIKLKNNISKNSPLYYIGSDKAFHYLKFFTHEREKKVITFKIVQKEIRIEDKKDLNFNRLLKDCKVFYTSDFK